MSPRKENKDLSCSFCGKSQKEVRKLIAGPSVYICDECVELCNDIVTEEYEREDFYATRGLVPKPKEIYDFLDEDDRPSSRVIVEGANLFLTPDARTELSDRGTLILKDSSANKCGVIPASYAKRFADGISGWAEIKSIDAAGHMAEIDRPDAVADAIRRFLVS